EEHHHFATSLRSATSIPNSRYQVRVAIFDSPPRQLRNTRNENNKSSAHHPHLRDNPSCPLDACATFHQDNDKTRLRRFANRQHRPRSLQFVAGHAWAEGGRENNVIPIKRNRWQNCLMRSQDWKKQ